MSEFYKCEDCTDMRRLLRKYGKHLPSCQVERSKRPSRNSDFDRWQERPECTCGFIAAIADPALMAVRP